VLGSWGGGGGGAPPPPTPPTPKPQSPIPNPHCFNKRKIIIFKLNYLKKL